GPSGFMVAAGVEHHVIDGDVDGMLGGWRLDLVGRAFEELWAFELFMHLDIGGRSRFGRLGRLVRLDHCVVDNLAGYLECHVHLPCPAPWRGCVVYSAVRCSNPAAQNLP